MPPCFICGKPLESVFPEPCEGIYNQPYQATVFHSHGHYGSTVFDPIRNGKYIEINICDTCLVKGKDRVLRVDSIAQEPVYEVRSWDPDDE